MLSTLEKEMLDQSEIFIEINTIFIDLDNILKQLDIFSSDILFYSEEGRHLENLKHSKGVFRKDHSQRSLSCRVNPSKCQLSGYRMQLNVC